MSSKVTLQIVASLIDAARGVIYDRNMAIPHVYGTGIICDDDRNSFIIQATGGRNWQLVILNPVLQGPLTKGKEGSILLTSPLS